MNIQLRDVHETALILLTIRANETKRKNARITRWYNIDLPDSIEVGRKIFKETERKHMLAVYKWQGKLEYGMMYMS